MPQIARYGWIPDLPDLRDYKYAAPVELIGALPAKVDLTSACPPVYDQGQLGSCTANAIAGAIEFDQIKQKLPEFTPSRLFIYYQERVTEETVDSDSGAQIRDGIKSVNHVGACRESMWPYDITQFATQPTNDCYLDAWNHKTVSYHRVDDNNLEQMKGCLASGYPFVFGFTVYSSFEGPEVAKTGHAPMPQPDEQVLGGHAVVAVGYDDENKWFIVRNSWGTGWGLNGYFTLPYDYLTNPDLASDFWTIRVVR